MSDNCTLGIKLGKKCSKELSFCTTSVSNKVWNKEGLQCYVNFLSKLRFVRFKNSNIIVPLMKEILGQCWQVPRYFLCVLRISLNHRRSTHIWLLINSRMNTSVHPLCYGFLDWTCFIRSNFSKYQESSRCVRGVAAKSTSGSFLLLAQNIKLSLSNLSVIFRQMHKEQGPA